MDNANDQRDLDHGLASAADGGSGIAGHLNGGSVSGNCRGVKIPASIVRAISAIKATVDAVKKSQKNPHGGYMFSSTDDIYAAVARKMGEVGYHLHALEEKCEIVRIEKDGKTVQWLHAVYSFLHATETDTWSHPNDKRTIYVLINGPQTFQGAQSFAEKAYLRSLLKLPSGDMDLDSMPQADTEEEQTAMSKPIKAGDRKSSYAAKKDGVSVAAFQALLGAIAAAPNQEALQRIYMDHSDANGAWAGMPVKWAKLLQDDFQVRMEALAAQQFAE